jgi:cyclopropane-fatty-acyl-phospholipid synthase
LQALLDRTIRPFVTSGSISITWPDGSHTQYGVGDAPLAAVAVKTQRAIRRMLLDPSLALGELYMDGDVVPQGCTIYDLLDVIGANLKTGAARVPGIQLALLIGKLRRRLDQFNPLGRAQRNVAHHYDLDARLYSLILDEDQQYSCAYFATGDETLEQAQRAKKRHIAAKLLLDRPDLHVLDIGCGWGGMALTLARDYGCRVHGITLSHEQLAAAQSRAHDAGLADRVPLSHTDYRALAGTYDRIVSVGMFEHVGVTHYDEYFAAVRNCLTEDGVALLHTIGRSDGPLSTNRWLAKYIFPGGYSPALSEITPAIERSGLVLTDLEVLRLHYAMTLRAWRERFAARRATIAALYDERFCRMFEFYLAVSEMAFRRLTHVNFQLQLTRSIHATPRIRDYMRDAAAPPLTLWRATAPIATFETQWHHAATERLQATQEPG